MSNGTQFRVGVLSWDWKGQLDIDELAAMVLDLSGGAVHIKHINNTGSDQYAIAVSTAPLTADDAAAAYDQYLFGDDS